MILNRRLILCAVLSIFGHLAFARGLRLLPPRSAAPVRRMVSIRVVSSPPPKPPPEPEPAKPEPTPPKILPRDLPRARPNVAVAAPISDQKDVPPPDRLPVVGDPSATPVFGVTMESTSQASNGPAIRVGNTMRPTAPRDLAGHEPPRPLSEPVAAYEVTTMPLPQGRCAGKYTDEAKQAAIEGTVVLDLVVGEDGRTRDIRVVSGLGSGLTQAAIDALRECRFSPGEKDGVAVPVRVRGFKIRFVLPDRE